MIAHSRELKPTKTVDFPVQDLAQFLSVEMKNVDSVIIDHLNSPIPLVSQIGQHLISAGGKRLRPLLTLASGCLFSKSCEKSIYLAAAVEFIHNATLLHDDVVDTSILRRGKQAAHTLWGNKASILVGDFLFAQAFNLMVKCQNLEILGTLSSASATIAEGEVLQLSLSHSLDITPDDYLRIIGAKTAELFAAACKSGALAAQASSKDCASLYHYGYNLGLAFQLVDDILDYIPGKDSLGKEKGDDFHEGKVTLPVIFSLKKAVPSEEKFWERTLINQKQKEPDLIKAIDIITNHGGFEKAYDLAQSFTETAISHLKSIPSSFVKDLLIGTAHYCVSRNR